MVNVHQKEIRGPSPRCLFHNQESFVYFSESHRDCKITLRVEILLHTTKSELDTRLDNAEFIHYKHPPTAEPPIQV